MSLRLRVFVPSWLNESSMQPQRHSAPKARPSPSPSLRGRGAGLPLPLLLLLLLVTPACHTEHTLDVTRFVITAEYGKARTFVHDNLSVNRREREYLLDRMMLGVLTVADGHPASAQVTFEEVYEVLRTQGINADKTVASVVFNEDVKTWKGEPFEQALAFAYYGIQQAMLGQWDNTRAAAGSSLFQLRDFGANKQGQRINTLEIAQNSLEAERKAAGQPAPKDDYINTGYAVRESNFTLGYLLHGLASAQLNRAQEASDYFNVAARIDPEVAPLVDELKTGQYNTILIVSYGLGPRKATYGPDNALAKFVPRFGSDRSPLHVSVAGGGQATYPTVCDVNVMAADHMWNNLEDVRAAKSAIGSVLLTGGAIATGVGIGNGGRSGRDVALIGAGVMAAGALMKSGSHADTRYCNVMPQRVYIVPLMIAGPNAKIALQVAGKPQSKLVLAGLAPPPAGQPAQLRYVRLHAGYPTAGGGPPTWASSGNLNYVSTQVQNVPPNPVPYLLGGSDVRSPNPRVLQSYAHHGVLGSFTPAELEGLYREEGIALTIEDQHGYAGMHILEGGNSLVEPLVGTAGFARLFGAVRQPYQPKSPRLRELNDKKPGP